jgi:hypothetical protein
MLRMMSRVPNPKERPKATTAPVRDKAGHDPDHFRSIFNWAMAHHGHDKQDQAGSDGAKSIPELSADCAQLWAGPIDELIRWPQD